jgi:glycosyltransferase involved in cell wall biosynthesis
LQRTLYFEWAVSARYGWGVYGLNLLRHWRRIAGTPACSLTTIDLPSFGGIDALSLRALAPVMVESDHMRLALPPWKGGPERLDGIVLHAMGNQFDRQKRPRDGRRSGEVTGCVVFFEHTHLPEAAAFCADYELVITGSTWCEQVLLAAGPRNVATVIQGVDPALFHPGPGGGALDGRFAVFSGGKLEYRKGQDLVLLAFRAFAERHPEAVLVTAWQSPFPAAARSLADRPGLAPVQLTEDGQVDVVGWAVANGLRAEQIIDLGTVAHHQMGHVLREVDVGLFPNRCEGGTNLVAMECMACGVPSIVADNSGQRDLVATGAPYALTRQRPIAEPGTGSDGWGESDIEEIVEMLEAVWRDRAAASARGAACARAMAAWSWRNQIARLHEALAPF